jgi:hypothetical protein
MAAVTEMIASEAPAEAGATMDDLPANLQQVIVTLAAEPAFPLSSLSRMAGVCRLWRKIALELLAGIAVLDLRVCGREREGSPGAAFCAALPHLLARCPALREVHARHVYACQGHAAMLLDGLTGCAKLELLNVAFVNFAGLQFDVLGDFARRCAAPGAPRLRRLDLIGCGAAVGRGAFVADLLHLTHLNVAFCRSFNPPRGWLVGGAGGVPPRVLPLRYLDLRMCDDLDLRELTEGAAAAQVQELNLAFVAAAGNSALLELAAMPELGKLTLGARTDNLWVHGGWTGGGLQEFRRRRPDVEVALRYS